MNMDAKHFPLVDVSGSPYERGVMVGKAVPERVLRSVNLYRGELERRGVKLAQVRQLAREFTPHVSAFDPAYLEEMQGIADGAKLALEDIILVNCRTEMMFGARIMIDEAMPDKNDGCTAVIVLPEASATGELIHAHNWDWREECVDTGIVLRIRRNDGPDILTFVEAGGLARHGLNADGVSVTGNFLGCDRDYKTGGRPPLARVRRKLLESANLAAALRTAWSGQRACSANVMLAAAEGEGIHLEMAPDEIFWITPEEAAMRRQRGKISIAAIKQALADEYGKPDSVLRPPKPALYSAISATVCTTVMLPRKGEMSIARKPWVERNFKKYSLSLRRHPPLS